MSGSDRQTFKKLYEKPRVTPVRLSVQHNVLQGCKAGAANMSGYDDFACWQALACERPPTL